MFADYTHPECKEELSTRFFIIDEDWLVEIVIYLFDCNHKEYFVF